MYYGRNPEIPGDGPLNPAVVLMIITLDIYGIPNGLPFLNLIAFGNLMSRLNPPKSPVWVVFGPGITHGFNQRNREAWIFIYIALHLKSGPTVFGVEARHNALNQTDKAIQHLLSLDQDVVILGDFNTMGAGDRQSQGSELKSVRRQLAKEKPGFKDLPPRPQCSHYFRGRGSWLDHVVVAKGMKEITEVAPKVTGYCSVANCKPIEGDYPLAYRRLSDHCPVTYEIQNVDRD